MGFGRRRLLGLFAQMIICGDAANIGAIWSGAEPVEEELPDEVELEYPEGYAEFMLHVPGHIQKLAHFQWSNLEALSSEERRQCEQFTLRKLNGILERSGVEYPKELPPLQNLHPKEQCKEWLAAHNYPESMAEEVYNGHKRSMEGHNKINAPNPEQLEILTDLEKEIEQYATHPDSYDGYCIMLDAPGGTGKTFLIETVAAYCALNKHLCLCSAFSGVAAQLL